MSRLADLRKALDMSQAQMAKQLGVSQGAVCMWETGECLPTLDKLPALAELLGCSMDALIEAILEEDGGAPNGSIY